jgi:hypothetical protein
MLNRQLLDILIQEAAETLISEGKSTADKKFLAIELENFLDNHIESILEEIEYHFYHNTDSIQDYVEQAEIETEKFVKCELNLV